MCRGMGDAVQEIIPLYLGAWAGVPKEPSGFCQMVGSAPSRSHWTTSTASGRVASAAYQSEKSGTASPSTVTMRCTNVVLPAPDGPAMAMIQGDLCRFGMRWPPDAARLPQDKRVDTAIRPVLYIVQRMKQLHAV